MKEGGRRVERELVREGSFRFVERFVAGGLKGRVLRTWATRIESSGSLEREENWPPSFSLGFEERGGGGRGGERERRREAEERRRSALLN